MNVSRHQTISNYLNQIFLTFRNYIKRIIESLPLNYLRLDEIRKFGVAFSLIIFNQLPHSFKLFAIIKNYKIGNASIKNMINFAVNQRIFSPHHYIIALF